MDSNRMNFVTEPDAGLTCCICLEVASQPKQCEDCGKLFCRKCIEKNGKNPCPSCRVEDPRFFKDAKSAREIMELSVRCNNCEKGCEWIGTVHTLDDHIASCQFVILSCPNKCGEMALLKKELDGHLEKCLLRAFECQDCGKKGTYVSMQDHSRVCEEVVVPCPNKEKGCPESVARGKMNQHVKDECDFIEVSCVYENLGCKVKMLRRDVVKHQDNDDKYHLHLAMGVISSPGEKCSTLGKEEMFAFKLTDYSTKKKNNKIFESEPFYSHPGGYKMCVVIYPNGVLDGVSTHLSVRIKILQGHNDKALLWPFCGYMDCELLNQLSNDNHHCLAVYFDQSSTMLVGSCKGTAKLLSISVLLNNPSKDVQYLVDNTLYFRVSVKARNRKWLTRNDVSTIEHHLSFRPSEPVIFKVTGYSVKKASNSGFSSKPFYINPGYRFQIFFLQMAMARLWIINCLYMFDLVMKCMQVQFFRQA